MKKTIISPFANDQENTLPAEQTSKNPGSICVIIVCYNQSKFITRNIQSVLNQTKKADQIIIIDNGSVDDTQKVISGFKENLLKGGIAKCEFIKKEQNIGAAPAFNLGLKHVKSDYVIFLPADDWFEKNILKEESEVLDQNRYIGAVYSQCWDIIEGRKKIKMPKPAGSKSVIGRNEFERLLTLGDFIPFSATMVRHSVIEELGGFDSKLRFRGDYDLWIRIAKHYPFAYIAEPLAYYRHHLKNDHLNPLLIESFEKEFQYILSKYFNPKKQSLSSLKIKKNAFYNYYLSIASNEIFANNIKRAGIFWMKALMIKPHSIITWKTLQPGYFFIRESFKKFIVKNQY